MGTPLVIIPVRGKASMTRRCLESLKSSGARDAKFRVLVIDDVSGPATRRALRASGLPVLRNARRRGFVGSVNRALREARAEWYVIGNSDLIAHDGWLDRLLAAARSSRLDMAGYFGRALGSRGAAAVRPTMSLEFSCCLVRASVFARVGLLDERFFPGYYDDDDLCLRARLADFRAGLVDNLSPSGKPYVTHLANKTFGRRLKEKLVRANYRRFLKKWDPKFPRSEIVRHYYASYLPDPEVGCSGSDMTGLFALKAPELAGRSVELHRASARGPLIHEATTGRHLASRERRLRP